MSRGSFQGRPFPSSRTRSAGRSELNTSHCLSVRSILYFDHEPLTLRANHESFRSLAAQGICEMPSKHIDVGLIQTRIFHCDAIIGTTHFEHVDCSQLVYDVETYERRLASHMKDKVKAQGHLKLFWIAKCPVEEWKSLLAATYPRNELIAEYLTGIPSHRPVSRRPPR
jgi:hypothetical protein